MNFAIRWNVSSYRTTQIGLIAFVVCAVLYHTVLCQTELSNGVPHKDTMKEFTDFRTYYLDISGNKGARVQLTSNSSTALTAYIKVNDPPTDSVYDTIVRVNNKTRVVYSRSRSAARVFIRVQRDISAPGDPVTYTLTVKQVRGKLAISLKVILSSILIPVGISFILCAVVAFWVLFGIITTKRAEKELGEYEAYEDKTNK